MQISCNSNPCLLYASKDLTTTEEIVANKLNQGTVYGAKFLTQVMLYTTIYKPFTRNSKALHAHGMRGKLGIGHIESRYSWLT